MLVDLYTGADVTIAVQEEGEGAGKMLTVGGGGEGRKRKSFPCLTLEGST